MHFVQLPFLLKMHVGRVACLLIIFISFSEVRTIGKSESPLEIQLQYGPHNTILEIRLVQVRDSRVNISRRGRDLMNDSDSDDEETLRGRRNMTPKDEGIYMIHTYIYAYIHTYIHAWMHPTYTPTYIHAYIEHATYIHTYVHRCIHRSMHACILTNLYIYIYINAI